MQYGQKDKSGIIFKLLVILYNLLKRSGLQ